MSIRTTRRGFQAGGMMSAAFPPVRAASSTTRQCPSAEGGPDCRSLDRCGGSIRSRSRSGSRPWHGGGEGEWSDRRCLHHDSISSGSRSVPAGSNRIEVLVLNTLGPYLKGFSATHFVFPGQEKSELFGPVRLLASGGVCRPAALTLRIGRGEALVTVGAVELLVAAMAGGWVGSTTVGPRVATNESGSCSIPFPGPANAGRQSPLRILGVRSAETLQSSFASRFDAHCRCLPHRFQHRASIERSEHTSIFISFRSRL